MASQRTSTKTKEPAAGVATAAPARPHLETHPLTFRKTLLVMNSVALANTAMQAAGAMVRLLGGEIEVLHLLPEVARHGAMGAPDEALVSAGVAASNQAFEEIARQPALRNIRLTHAIERGTVTDVLLALAHQRRFDLVVLADATEVGPRRVLRGSSAELLTRRLGVPVLLVGPQAKVTEPWTSILLGTALRADSLRPAQYAVAIAEQLQCAVTLEHVLPFDPWLNDAMREDVLCAAQRQLEELLPKDAAEWCRPRVRVVQGEVSGNILDTAMETKANLIVLGLARGGDSNLAFGSILGDVVREAPCPVLAVPASLQ